MPVKNLLRYLFPRLIFLIASVILILVAKGWKFDFEEGVFVQTGILEIDTDPNGAELRLNGEAKGTTPLILRDIAPGRYDVSLQKTGFHEWKKTITMLPEMVNRQGEVVLFPVEPRTETVIADQLGIDAPPSGDTFIRYDAVDSGLEMTLYNGKGIHTGTLSLPFTSAELPRRSLIWSPDQSSLVISLMDETGVRYLASYLIDLKASTLVALELSTLPAMVDSLDPVFTPTYISASELLIRDMSGRFARYDFRKFQNTFLGFESREAIPLFVVGTGFFGAQYLYGLTPTVSADIYQLTQYRLDNGASILLDDIFTLSKKTAAYVSPDHKTAILSDTTHGIVLTGIDTSNPTLRPFERPIGHAFGWTPDSRQFLFASGDQQLAYYDLAQKTFLFPLALVGSTKLVSACWHSNTSYLFFTTQDDELKPHQTLQVIERDGQNQTPLLSSDSLFETAPSGLLLCASADSLLYGTESASGVSRLNRLFFD